MSAVLHAIAAMAENRVIGREGKIPWHLPLDFRWFKHKTSGGTVVMGRRTFESLGRPLPQRRNVVLTRRPIPIAGAECVGDVAALRALLPPDQTAWIIGGAEIYGELLPACSLLYLTRVKRAAEGDVFFPVFERDFTFDQLIHDNDEFRVERWRRNETPPAVPEPWPFPA